MCGINGFNFENKELLEKMNKATFHRGPDFSGIFVDEKISLGHNLLAIREVSDISKQPYNLNSNWIMSFNGQIYNTEKLKIFLRENKIELDSSKENLDTYIIYKLIELVGFGFVNKIFGMFAIALYNKGEQKINLYRDSSGQKNLYYYHKDNKFIFSSEIKGILEHDKDEKKLDREIDIEAVNLAVTLGYIPGDKTLFKYIKKVNAGECVSYDLQNNKLEKSFFKPETENHFEGNFETVLQELMKEHLQAKDKISINLSGGLDSSLLLHEANSLGYIADTYTTSFEIDGDEQKNYNEDAQLAEKLSNDYKTKHKEIKITKENYLENFIESYGCIEEPNYNISLPIYLITAKTEGIHGDGKRVVLSGDGGDEVFGGYPYYLENKKIDFKRRLLTPFIYDFFRPEKSNLINRWIDFKDLRKHYINNYKTKFIYEYLNQKFKNYKNIFSIKVGNIYECMLLDRIFWLTSENFIRSDKLYMSQSLELRSPFSYEPFRTYCDKIILNNQYINEKNNKLFLRIYAENKLPKYITQREKKSGWRAPVDLWYDKDFKKMFLEILNSAKSIQNKNNAIIDWSEIIKQVENNNSWPGKWLHLYLSLAILSKKFNLNL